MANGGSTPQLRTLPALELGRPLLDAGSFFFVSVLLRTEVRTKALAANGLAGPLLDARGGTAERR